MDETVSTKWLNYVWSKRQEDKLNSNLLLAQDMLRVRLIGSIKLD